LRNTPKGGSLIGTGKFDRKIPGQGKCTGGIKDEVINIPTYVMHKVLSLVPVEVKRNIILHFPPGRHSYRKGCTDSESTHGFQVLRPEYLLIGSWIKLRLQEGNLIVGVTVPERNPPLLKLITEIKRVGYGRF
jgi:hypothetical protein